tara:strand:+ start:169 stop:714 length:546 start_codon:yes stop_codon:yes gene_type:complete
MFAALFVKKRITHKLLAKQFVHKTLRAVDETFEDFLDAIYNDTELEAYPKLNYKDPSVLMHIIVAGNMKFFERILSSHEENAICNSIIKEMSVIFEMDFNEMQEKLESYSSFISRVNHPSKNILYGMSKSVFFKFKLGKYQDDYFAQLNTPNPIFLKKIDLLIENYVWDWKTVFEKSKIIY